MSLAQILAHGLEWDEVWRVRVLEFVLESLAFCSTFAALRNFGGIVIFPFVKAFRFETKSDVLKSMISQS